MKDPPLPMYALSKEEAELILKRKGYCVVHGIKKGWNGRGYPPPPGSRPYVECSLCLAQEAKQESQEIHRALAVLKFPSERTSKGIYFSEAERLLLCKITEGYTAGGSMGEVLAKLHGKR